MTNRLALAFAEGATLEPDERTALLGGKGAALARMVSMGLPVPPGFTFTTEACHRFLSNGWETEFDEAIASNLAELESVTSRGFGDVAKPLLVSVRSGSPVSMPGMMDTVLNIGITNEIAERLSAMTQDERFGWDTLRRFLQSYVSVVIECPRELMVEVSAEHLGADEGQSLTPAELARAVVSMRESLAERGFEVPDDPRIQLREAVKSVFRSWNCDRAIVYRKVENIDDGLGTAATVQMMTFGNLGERSGTGVAFSRDPSTGAPGLMGDFLQNAQGEDVVAGTHTTVPVAALRDLWPEVATELEQAATLLERDQADLVDIEFTIESGEFWLLQVRRGKRSPQAALRMAIDMAEDAEFPLNRGEALERVSEILENPPMVASESFTPADGDVLATGLAASPGRATGVVCTDVDDAIEAQARGVSVILVRQETSPADIAGMAAATGIITSLGGLVSHAAVVARSWGLPSVVGVSEIDVRPDGIGIDGRLIENGTEITVDGALGQVLLGAHDAHEIEVPEVAILRGWQRTRTETPAETLATPPAFGHSIEEATLETVGRALALKGMGDAEAIAAVLGASAEDVTPLLNLLVEADDAQPMPNDRVRPTPALVQKVNTLYRAAANRVQSDIEPYMEPFHHVNDSFKALVADWQLRMIDGVQTPNDHTDAGYDAAVVARLRSEIHDEVETLIGEVAKAEPRLARYFERLESSLQAVEAGDSDMFAHPFKDSYHTVWFELHEELIRLSGRNRADEAAAGRG